MCLLASGFTSRSELYKTGKRKKLLKQHNLKQMGVVMAGKCFVVTARLLWDLPVCECFPNAESFYQKRSTAGIRNLCAEPDKLMRRASGIP